MAAFLLRLAVTLAVELLIAVAFRLRTRRQLLTVLCANLATQIALNFVLAWAATTWLVIPVYVLAEVAVFLIEAEIYTRLLRDERMTRGYLTVYSFAANLASLLAGLLLPAIPRI